MLRFYFLAQRTFGFQRILTHNMEAFLESTLPLTSSNLRTFKLMNNGQFLQQKQQKSTSDTMEKTTGTSTQKKQKTSPKITLIGMNQSISVTSLEEAQKLAKRRELHLMLVQELDTKTQRPVYKLVTPAEFLAEELKDLKGEGKNVAGKNAAKKSEKTLTIGSRISDNDLSSRQKNIYKWLTKQHEVRILIQGSIDEMPKMEKIFKTIEQSIKEPEIVGKIQQKRSKDGHIKFNIVPIMPETNETSSSTTTTPTSTTTTPIIPKAA